MKRVAKLWLVAIMALACSACSDARKSSVSRVASHPLILVGVMTMPGVQGRLDHFGLGSDGRLFVSAYGNGTVEVLSLPRETVIGNIPVAAPQGVVYTPESNELFVGSDTGELRVFRGDTLKPIKTISYGDDVDDLRYDQTDKRVYLGFGDGQAGAIGAVDAQTNAAAGPTFKLGAHPEAFELERHGPNIYVNLPTVHQIAVINRRSGAITRWHLALGGNFPMALDEADHRLFVATHDPPRLAVFDSNSGRLITTMPCVANEDDMYYDARRKRVYITGGEGYISVFQQQDADHYQWLANIPSVVGARTSGYWGPQEKGFDRFYVGVPAPARSCDCAEVLIYSVHE